MWIPLISMPIMGGLIGWVSNWLAITMLFHPHRSHFGVQGLLPKRQRDLADKIGQVVSAELVSTDDLLSGLDAVDLEPHLAALLDHVMREKTEELQRIPLIGRLITEDRLSGIRNSILRSMVANKAVMIGQLKQVAREHVDIAAIASAKVAAFDLDKLERVIKQVAHRELIAIRLWDTGLGAFIGLLQAAVMYFAR